MYQFFFLRKTGTLEAQLALKTGELITLSEQELLDCSHSNYGCDGGVVQYAYDYIISSGLSSAENYPTTGSVGSCKHKRHKAVRMEDYYSITPYDESELKLAVGVIGMFDTHKILFSTIVLIDKFLCRTSFSSY